MKIITKLVIFFFVNAFTFLAAERIITGFLVNPGMKPLFIAAASLTLINTLIKPVIKFILTPLIILTLGLSSLVLNGIILWLLDFFLISITITGLGALLYATLFFTAVNVVFHIIFQPFLRKK